MSEENKPEGAVAEATPAAKPAKAEEAKKDGSKEEIAEQNRKAFDPGPEHPRFKEVYKKMKRLEDDVKDIEVIRAHNQKLAAKLEEIEKSRAPKDPEEPDPLTDPDGYKTWHKFQLAKKDKEIEERIAKERIQTQIEVQKELHSDYMDAVAVVEREMARDQELQKKIWNSENPAKAAYQYGRKKIDETAKADKEEDDRQARLDQGEVAKPTPPAPKKEEQGLSEEQKRVARRLFNDIPGKEAEEKYLKQLKTMGK
jgi:hypothetical protein